MLAVYEGVITILIKHSLPFFSSFYLSWVVWMIIKEKDKNRRQRSFHSLTKIIKRKGGWILSCSRDYKSLEGLELQE